MADKLCLRRNIVEIASPCHLDSDSCTGEVFKPQNG